MLFSLSWADALRKALQKALFCSGKALRARENKLLLLSWADALRKALQKALPCSRKALCAKEKICLSIRIDLHTARATIKTQKALARASPLDDES